MLEKILQALDWNRLYKYLKIEVKLKKGAERVFLCVYHDEQTPSMFINKEKGIGHCFGCDQKFNLVSLIAHVKKIEYKEAFEKLLELAGLEEDSLTPQEIKEKVKLLDQANNQTKRKKKILQVDELPKTVELSKKARNYLHTRFITDDTIKQRKIQFCDYGFYNDRLIIPLYDSNGKYRTFEARLVRKPRDKEERKVLYCKKKTDNHMVIDDLIYNYAQCKEYSEVIGTEGIMDGLSLISRGIKNTVSFMGVNLTEERKKMMTTFDKVIILLDYDKAGIMASKKIKEDLDPFLTCKICKTFSNKDVKHMDLTKIKIAIQNSKVIRNDQINFLKLKIKNLQET